MKTRLLQTALGFLGVTALTAGVLNWWMLHDFDVFEWRPYYLPGALIVTGYALVLLAAIWWHRR